MLLGCWNVGTYRCGGPRNELVWNAGEGTYWKGEGFGKLSDTKMTLKHVNCEDVNVAEACVMAGCGISGVEHFV